MTVVEVFTIYGGPGNQTPYMSRVIWGRLRIHVFHRGDEDPDPHDHPTDFWTFPLTPYVEEVTTVVNGLYHLDRRVVKAFRPHFRKAETLHRVIGLWSGVGTEVVSGQIATLVWWGKKRREWGFQTPGGWVPWEQYVDR